MMEWTEELLAEICKEKHHFPPGYFDTVPMCVDSSVVTMAFERYLKIFENAGGKSVGEISEEVRGAQLQYYADQACAELLEEQRWSTI